MASAWLSKTVEILDPDGGTIQGKVIGYCYITKTLDVQLSTGRVLRDQPVMKARVIEAGNYHDIQSSKDGNRQQVPQDAATSPPGDNPSSVPPEAIGGEERGARAHKVAAFS